MVNNPKSNSLKLTKEAFSPICKNLVSSSSHSNRLNNRWPKCNNSCSKSLHSSNNSSNKRLIPSSKIQVDFNPNLQASPFRITLSLCSKCSKCNKCNSQCPNPNFSTKIQVTASALSKHPHLFKATTTNLVGSRVRHLPKKRINTMEASWTSRNRVKHLRRLDSRVASPSILK